MIASMRGKQHDHSIRSGHIQNVIFYYLGFKNVPIFLFDGPEPVIFDAGVTCAGDIYVKSHPFYSGTKATTAWLCITHVHWDHCGAASATCKKKKASTKMKIAATSMAANILQRPNALSLTNRLNQGHPGADAVEPRAGSFRAEYGALLRLLRSIGNWADGLTIVIGAPPFAGAGDPMAILRITTVFTSASP